MVDNIEVKFGWIAVVLPVEDSQFFPGDYRMEMQIRVSANELKEFGSHFGMVVTGVKKPVRLPDGVNASVKRIDQNLLLERKHRLPQRPAIRRLDQTKN